MAALGRRRGTAGVVFSVVLFAGSLVAGGTVASAESEPVGEACPADHVASQGFTDVASNGVHALAINCVGWWSIAAGSAGATYRPGKEVTRAQMATFVSRLMAAGGYQFASDPPDAFSDDEGSLAHESAINQLAAAGIVSGTAPGRYSPASVVTRDQMATFLVRAYGATTSTQPETSIDHFTDDETSRHQANVNIAASLGIATGTGGSTYEPARPVMRGQMATFVSRVLDLFVQAALAEPPPSSFGDGTWSIPEHVAPGLYRNSDSSATCRWERWAENEEGIEGVVTSDITPDIAIVRVTPTDTRFAAVNCGTWSTDLTPRTESTTDNFGGGAYQVVSEVAAATWRNSDSSAGCHWIRWSDFAGDDEDVIEEGFDFELATVTLEQTDVGFYSQNCGTWSLVPAGGGDGGGDGTDEATCFGCVTLTEVVATVVPGIGIPTSADHCVSGTATLAGGQVIGPNVSAPARTFTYTVPVTILGTPECTTYRRGFAQEETTIEYSYRVSVRSSYGAGVIWVLTGTPALGTELPRGTTTNVTVTFEVYEGNFYNGPLHFWIILD